MDNFGDRPTPDSKALRLFDPAERDQRLRLMVLFIRGRTIAEHRLFKRMAILVACGNSRQAPR